MSTRYIIRRISDGRYHGGADGYTWLGWTVNQDSAQRFDFMTAAAYYALTVLDLGGYEFTIEPV